jgi:2-phospho-L-lactate guanylyltransferase
VTTRRIAATAHTHEGATGAGSVLLDDGRVLRYGAPAFEAGGLRLLRPGQRVVVDLDADLDSPGAQVLRVSLAGLDA